MLSMAAASEVPHASDGAARRALGKLSMVAFFINSLMYQVQTPKASNKLER